MGRSPLLLLGWCTVHIQSTVAAPRSQLRRFLLSCYAPFLNDWPCGEPAQNCLNRKYVAQKIPLCFSRGIKEGSFLVLFRRKSLVSIEGETSLRTVGLPTVRSGWSGHPAIRLYVQLRYFLQAKQTIRKALSKSVPSS